MALIQRSICGDGAFRRERHSEAGIALVIVLGMLTLVAILVVAFLSSVSTELQSARSYASESDARALADSAVNIVISQIQDATATPSLAWASQPGMIRTYDDTGAARAAYKLYSSGQLRVSGAFDAPANVDTEVPPTWADAGNSHLYTDLNRPVVVSDGATTVEHYPIIDPAAVGATQSDSTPLKGSSSEAVPGCYLNQNSPTTAVSAGQTNPVPLPVQWMYVLKDGSVVAMNPATRKVAGAGAKLADGTTNTIVGRVAFWTDDESCKVNVNTASEGTYWDRPWVAQGTPNNIYERDLAMKRPAQNEFQRYPGHPAMTSLSAVFPAMTGESMLDYSKRIYGIIPRVVGGGSEGGTVEVNQTTAALVPDTERLFASVDEFLFKVSGEPRQENLKGPNTPFTPADIERSRFFLTVNSRAPEVNLFNKPRITLWPLQANTSNVSDPATAPDRNAKDKLLAFCSTIGKTPYYFQRYNTYTSTTQNPIPSSQSPTMDWDKVPRNQQLYSYLQTLTSQPIPGMGGKLSGTGGKYNDTTRDQILTEIFDFVRSNVNTFSSAGTPKYNYTPFSPTGFVTGQSQVVPLALPNGTKGFGRFSTITEAALIFYRRDSLLVRGPTVPGGEIKLQGNSPLVVSGNNVTFSDFDAPVSLGAVLVLEPFNPSPGPPPWTTNVRFVVKGLDGFFANSTPMGFPAKAVNLVSAIDSTINATAMTGLETFLQKPPRSPKTLGATSESNPVADLYPIFANFSLPTSGPTFAFGGGGITVEIYQGTVGPLDPKDLVQTIHMQFPSATLAVPTYARTVSYNSTSKVTTITDNETDGNGNNYTDFNKRLSHLATTGTGNGRYGIAEDSKHNPLPLVVMAGTNTGDTVRSVEARYGGPAKGDYRIFAGLQEVPADYFEGHGMSDAAKGTAKVYSDSTVAGRLVHSLSMDGLAGSADTSNQNGYFNGAGGAGDLRGKLVATAAYPDPNRGNNARNRKVPIVPRGLDAARMANGSPGDWDTGIGGQPDGPYINRADESSANKSQSGSMLYYDTGGYINGAGVVESGASFSPNRQISSAVAFGSLPSGIDPGNPSTPKPWQTLLFCKNPASGSDHPGFGVPRDPAHPEFAPPYTKPPDHVLLDLFTMPIVEPYAISEPFSTAGKVNMNYQIVPFTYLTRDTGIRAVLKSTNMMAIPTNHGDRYKWSTTAIPTPDYRYSLNLDEKTGTLAGFEKRFASGDIFRSASEICDLYLVPKDSVNSGQSPATAEYSTMGKWWEDFQLTGDNLREGPYGHIYPRLTTKSNTFTVHVKTQSLKKLKKTAVDEFVEGLDQVTGEFRGSFVVQRYLDPNRDTLVQADGKTAAGELDSDAMVGPYKMRVLSSKRFAP